eukprot:EG_transcript_14453
MPLFSSKPHRFEETEEVSWDFFLQNVGTGDVLMHHGTGKNSTMMQKGMQCYYSHTAMFVRNPQPDVLALFNVAEPCRTAIYVWESTAQEPEGTRLIPWLKWLDHERQRNGEGYLLVWRKLGGLDPAREAKLWDCIRQSRHVPYEKHRSEMFKALINLNKTDKVESMFCSELVAFAMKTAGLVSDRIVVSNMTTASFSHFYHHDSSNIEDGLLNCTLAPEKRVTLPLVAKPFTI